MKKYIDRISDKKLERYLGIFGSVLIEGPKWCGKTESGKKHANSIFEIANPANNFANRLIAQLNPDLALNGDFPRLIDEWQEVPSLWDAIRYRADQNPTRGQYILTGSSVPNDSLTIHSGAGRIGRLKMSTMTLEELGVSRVKISLGDLLYNKTISAEVSSGALTMDEIVELLCKGGWPGLINTDLDGAIQVLRDYMVTISQEDISKVDGTKRDPAKVAALLQSIARNTASLVSNETIRKDITQHSSTELRSETIAEYLNLLSRMFILQEIPAWNPALKSTVRLRSAPKRILVDPSLAIAALETSPSALMQDPKFVGNLFEGLVLHDLTVYAGANKADIYHYNDNADLEIDAIIEGEDKNWGAIEVKLGYTEEDKAASNLLRLTGKIEEERQKPPRFLAVITGIGSILQKRDDGVWVIPIDALGA